MRGWMLMAAPFVAYGFYLVGTGEAERRITNSNARLSCNAAAQEAGVPYIEVSSACACVRRASTRWSNAHSGMDPGEAREQAFRDSCFAAKIAPARASGGGHIVDDIFASQKGDWSTPPAEEDQGEGWAD